MSTTFRRLEVEQRRLVPPSLCELVPALTTHFVRASRNAETTESTNRQYNLRQCPIERGWRGDQMVVIDSDLGHSGPSAIDGEGRPSRGVMTGANATDWHP